jgi:hypothetical protein
MFDAASLDRSSRLKAQGTFPRVTDRYGEPQAPTFEGCRISQRSRNPPCDLSYIATLYDCMHFLEHYLSSYWKPSSTALINRKIYLLSSISQQQVRQTSPGHATQQALGAAIPKQMSSPANERSTCCLGSIFPRLDAVSVPPVRRHLPTRATIVLRLSYRPYVPDDSYIIILPAANHVSFPFFLAV